MASEAEQNTECQCFWASNRNVEYIQFCDDFGPMSASSIFNFILEFQAKLVSGDREKIVLCAQDGVRNLTNAAFLLGCYMILVLQETADNVWDAHFQGLDEESFEWYRDATFSDPRFRLTLLDCWRGLEQAQTLGWIGRPSENGDWGRITPEEYNHYDRCL